MREYVFQVRKVSEWQKVFNQWRHEYTFEILFSHILETSALDDPHCVILVERLKNGV